MKNIENNNWLCAHLYYSSNHNKFLVEAVKPFVEHALKCSLAENYFFIRYWEKGPHIRLRFLSSKANSKHDLKQKLYDHFNKYFELYPSSHYVNSSVYEKNLSDGKVFPDNSIQFIEYEPELERYGGNAGMSISEKQFYSCSNTVLRILSGTDLQSDEQEDERALGAAIQLHLSIMHTFGFTRKDMIVISEFIFKEWAVSAYKVITNIPYPEINFETAKQIHNSVKDAFKPQIKLLKEQLQSFINEFYAALDENYIFEEDWLNQWLVEMKSIHKQLHNGIMENEITIPEWYFKIENNYSNATINSMSYLLRSYIHMINNRLGVPNHNEAFIAFILSEFLSNK